MRYSLREVWSIENKPEPWVIRLIWKPLIVYFVWVNANSVRLKPNEITLLGGLFGVMSGFGFYWGMPLIGALLFLLWRIMDYADGMTARLQETESCLGAFLDNYVGGISLFFVSHGLALHLSLTHGTFLWLLFPSVLLFLVLFQSQNSLRVANTLPKKAHEHVVDDGDTIKGESALNPILRFLKKNRLAPPLGKEDVIHAMFIGVPILLLVEQVTSYLLVPLMLLLILNSIFSQYFYITLLREHDAKHQ
ncbi:MAG: CDP-alcohol phosphatidyltransferase family protein [Candidatus Woesearchaeota archaeon]